MDQYRMDLTGLMDVNGINGHGVGGYPPDESLRWDETPLAAVRLARIQLPIVTEINTRREQ